MTEAKKYASKRVSSTDYPVYNDEYELELAFEEGAKWQKKQVWHTQNDNPPQEGKKIIFLWGQSNNIKDLNEDVGRLRLIYGEKVICGWSRWHLEDVKLWAYIEDLLPESLDAF